jgi:hypothetical protein
MNIIFIKPTGRSLTGSSKRHKNKEGGRYENQHESVWAQCVHITQISDIKGYAPTMGKEKQKV